MRNISIEIDTESVSLQEHLFNRNILLKAVNGIAVEKLLDEITSSTAAMIKTLLNKISGISDSVDTVLKEYEKSFKKFSEKTSMSVGDDTDLEDLVPEVKILSSKQYKAELTACKSLISKLKNVRALVSSKDPQLMTSEMQAFITDLKTLGITVSKNAGSLSGYYGSDRSPLSDGSLKDLGYDGSNSEEILGKAAAIKDIIASSSNNISTGFKDLAKLTEDISAALVVDKSFDKEKEHKAAIDYYLRILGRIDFFVKVVYPGITNTIDDIILTYSNVMSLLDTGESDVPEKKLLDTKKKSSDSVPMDDGMGTDGDSGDVGEEEPSEEESEASGEDEVTDDELDF